MIELIYDILIVDDSPIIRKVLSKLVRDIEDIEVDIHTAESAEDALEIMKEKRIDLVISDNYMDGISGVEFLGLIENKWPGTKKVLISGGSNCVKFSDIKSAKIDECFEKPWNNETLKNKLRLIIKNN